MSADDFKALMMDLNRRDFLDLARADLVGAMSREQVMASEIVDRGASFHFVIDDYAGSTIP